MYLALSTSVASHAAGIFGDKTFWRSATPAWISLWAEPVHLAHSHSPSALG